MRYLTFTLLAITLFSCKKYKEDNFISTYSVEKRLLNTSTNMWTLQTFISLAESEKTIIENNFNLFFSKDSVIFSTLNNEYIGSTKWKFDSGKKYISLNNGQKFEILQLEVDKLKLKNEKGEIYSFKKKILQELMAVSDESVFNVPLFGVNNYVYSMKLFDVNPCETNNISITVNGSVSSNPILEGLLGNGLGYANQNTLNSINYNFSKYYAKPGEMSFYYKKNAWTTYSLAVKINGVQTTYSVGADVVTGTNTSWGLIKVNVPNSGNLNFSIISTKSGGVSAINVIDEIKFWEYE